MNSWVLDFCYRVGTPLLCNKYRMYDEWRLCVFDFFLTVLLDRIDKDTESESE
jgi:hypothetical protein